VGIPEQFMLGAFPTDEVSAAPAQAGQTQSVEKAQSVDGTQYTVVAPIFPGNDGNLSYIRFNNRGAANTVTTITIVGYPTGQNYGTVNVNVPGHASPQYSISEILQAKNIAGPTGGDQGFSLYLKNGDPNAGFAHVIWNSSNLFFENVSMCTMSAGIDYSQLGSWLFNVHTSTLSTYPSYVFIHNFSANATTFQVDLYEARFGGYKGTLSIQAAANGTYRIPFSWFEQQVSWTPSSSEMHANLNFHGAGTYVVGQTIFNQAFNAYVNMTQYCVINH
jgi:hypothetical protein